MGKGEDWKDSETECLIAVWRDPHIQQTLNNSKRNIHVYQQISETLKEVYGIDRSGESCRSKVKNMKSWYKREKDKRSLLGSGSDNCKENAFFILMEEVMFGNPSPSGTKPLFPTNLFSNLTKHDSAFSSGKKDNFEIKTEIVSNSESEQESLDLSNDKDETHYSDTGKRNAVIENSNGREVTLSNIETRESIQMNEETIPSTLRMEIRNSSKTNDICGMEISSSQNDIQQNTFLSSQNNKSKSNFSKSTDVLPNMMGRSHLIQMNNAGVRNRIIGTNNFNNNMRKPVKRKFVPRRSNSYFPNKKRFDYHTQSRNSNRIQQMESNNDFSQSQLEQLCDSTRENHLESSERIKITKENCPVSDHENRLVSIAKKLTELVDKLIESEKQQLLVRQKEAEIDLQRQENEKLRIANEKQRIVMEEIQRREDREHHYRVMQLVLGRTGHTENSLSSVLLETKTGFSVINTT